MIRRIASILARFFMAPLAAGAILGASSAAALDDPCLLGDEFLNPFTLPLWQRVETVEQWNCDQLETWDIGATRPGWMTMRPWTVTWYQDYRGPLAFKRVGGDFIVTTSVHAVARDGVSVPATQFSLAGVMLRTPRNITPATWTPGGENYVFLSLGYGNAFPPRRQFEVKTTVAGISTLILSDAPGPDCELRSARIGPNVILLRREPAGAWQIHRRYRRNDFPDTLQVGLVAYTDWGKVSDFTPLVHNGNALHLPLPPGVTNPTPAEPFQPDLLAQFDYVRFAQPQVPANLVGVDLTNPALVSDAQLLAFLGASVDTFCSLAAVPDGGGSAARLTLEASANPFRGATRFRVGVPDDVAWRLTVYDVAGREVARFDAVSGERGVAWDGRDRDGRRLPAGLYVARLTAGGRIASTKVILAR